MMRPDPVRHFLHERGSPPHVVEGGLEGLLRGWEETVTSLAKGYPVDTLDDYLNDLDGRQILDEALAFVPPRQFDPVYRRLALADSRFLALVTPVSRCLWGERAATANGWDPDRNWWYWRRPRHAGPDLHREIDALLPPAP